MKNRFSVFLSLTILYALLIFYLSSQSSLGSPKLILDMEIFRSILHYIEHSDLKFILYPAGILYRYPDKSAHIILYAVFGFLLYLTLKNSQHPTFRNHSLIFAIAIGILYGISDELHQSFVPGRNATLTDLLADAAGLTMAQAVIFARNKLSAKKLRASTLDLKLVAILIAFSMIFILVPPFNQTFLRIILALPLLLFLPGYLLIAVMFPGRGELNAIERFTLSIGLSIAITVFDGFALNYTRWGFRPDSIVISLSMIMVLLLIAAYFQRWRLGETGYGFSYRDITSFYHTLTSKEKEAGIEYDPALEKMLIKTMVIAIIIVIAMLIYAKVTTEPEKFTALYILGANGKAENYPTEVRIGEPTSILVGVENHEHEPVKYKLQVKLGGKTLEEEEIALEHEKKWLSNVKFIPQLTSSIAFAGANKSKLEFQLLKDNISYRSVQLLVKTSLGSVNFAAIPDITNGDMESEEGWSFSGSSANITGKYTNNTGNSSSRKYEINLTAGDEKSYGTIYQNLTTYGDARAVLSFDVRDSGYSNISYSILKQALIDEQVVWESGIGGKNSSVEHVKVPVLLSGNNTLAFRVRNRYTASANVTVRWDNVQLEPYDVNRTESKRTPVKKVYEFNFDIRGAPLVLEKSMKIDGSTFPGFNYDVNENRSLEELSLNITDNNKIDTGNATYTVRRDGSDIHIMGLHYKILDNNLTSLSRIIATYPNKILTVGDSWSLNTYSFSVRLVSSKWDIASIELQKDGQILDLRFIGRGPYWYKIFAGTYPLTIFSANVDSITGENVYLSSIEIYSDHITSLNPGSILGDFEVINISADEIVFKNSYPIELKNKTAILNGSIGLSLQGNMVYPYATGVRMRGVPQYIYYGRWMNITGFNYPGFYLENNTSYEELRMYFSGNGMVEPGNAVYTARTHSGMLSFLGNTYELAYQNRPGYITTITASKKLILDENETREMSNNFRISFKDKGNSTIMLNIRKALTKEQQRQINITNESRFFKDIYYEMYTGRNGTLRKSNILSTGDTFEYWVEYKEDVNYKAIAGELEAINNSSIELNLREYDIPFEITPGRSFGEFDVESVTNDIIILRNTKPMRFMPGKETSILNGALKIKTSQNEYLAYPEN